MPGAVKIIGGGLAGAEAAWQLANHGVPVYLYEMRPVCNTPAHSTDLLAELVCSNSLRAISTENAVGLLKEEMRRLGSVIMSCADENKVCAGGALAVDRSAFAQAVTAMIENHPLIDVRRREYTQIDAAGPMIVASGPLTSNALAQRIKDVLGQQQLYFYDAVAPIVTYASIDMNQVFWSSRYDKGGADYLKCPMDQGQYTIFWQELVRAQTAPRHDFEQQIHFEGCMPVEELARRGQDTMRFGPLKPVGLTDPRTGQRPYAVVQLRRDNAAGSLFNLVGFQTSLKWGEQKRVFSLIPGLGQAEFVRYGVMHRNTYINAPTILKPGYQTKNNPDLFFAGQITGVEGYVESAASGLIAGISAVYRVKKRQFTPPPLTTAHGALINYITTADVKNFTPMNINFGLFPPPDVRCKNKKQRSQYLSRRALEDLERWKTLVNQDLKE